MGDGAGSLGAPAPFPIYDGGGPRQLCGRARRERWAGAYTRKG